MQFFLRFMGWFCGVFAVVNTGSVAYRYIILREFSLVYDLSLAFYIAIALTIWQLLCVDEYWR